MDPTTANPPRKLSQETVAVFSVGVTLLAACVALAGLILVSTGRLADEIRAHREEMRAEMRADREELRGEMRADREALRAEMRADREALRAEAQADRIAFARQIARLAEQQARLDGLVEGLRERLPAPVPADG